MIPQPFQHICEAANFWFWTWDVPSDRREFHTLPPFLKPYARNGVCTFEEWESTLFPEDACEVRASILRCLQGETPSYSVTLRIYTPDGGIAWIQDRGWVTECGEDGAPMRLEGVQQDISPVKTMENRLDAMQKRNNRLMRDLAAAKENLRASETVVFRQRTLLTAVNDVTVRLLSAKPEAIAEEMLPALQSVGQSVDADAMYLMRDSLENGEPGLRILHGWDEGGNDQLGASTFLPYHIFGDWHGELRQGLDVNAPVYALPELQRTFFERIGVQSIRILPVFLAGSFWGVTYFANSHTVRLSDEAEMQTVLASSILMVLAVEHAEASSQLTGALQKAQISEHVKTIILANVNHEMKTPLNAITGMSGIARLKPEKLDTCLEVINDAAHRLRSLIDSMLEMSNIACGELYLEETPFFFTMLLGKVLAKNAPAAKEKNLSLRTGADPNCRWKAFAADAGRLEEVINRMVHNAIKFTPPGGMVSVHVREEEAGQGWSRIRVCIRDNGIGITGEDIAGLLSPFEQAEKQLSRPFGGTGLGLAIAHGIITAMGGTLDVSSEPDNGSHFSITLPLRTIHTSEPLAGEGYDAEPPAVRLKGKRILVVDDNMVNREVLTDVLVSLEAATDTAENGLEALDMVRDSPTGYDLVLMDIQMPIMDGMEATAKIRALPCAVPILAVTANSLREDIARYKGAGMNGHVPKPVDLGDLIRAIGQCFEKKTAKTAGRGTALNKQAESAA